MAKTTILIELIQFVKERKKWWLAPIILFIAVMGALLIFTLGSPWAPFIYALF